MQRFINFFLLFTVIFGLTFSSSYCANRFRVLTYADDKNITNPDSFYTWLNDFGASLFYTNNTNFLSNYAPIWLGDSLEIYTAHLFDTVNIGTISFPFYLHNQMNKQVYIHMNGHNTNPVHGYVRLADSTIGSTVYDGSIFRNVACAKVNENDAGFLHPRFGKGVFYRLSRKAAYEPIYTVVTFKAKNL